MEAQNNAPLHEPSPRYHWLKERNLPWEKFERLGTIWPWESAVQYVFCSGGFPMGRSTFSCCEKARFSGRSETSTSILGKRGSMRAKQLSYRTVYVSPRVLAQISYSDSMQELLHFRALCILIQQPLPRILIWNLPEPECRHRSGTQPPLFQERSELSGTLPKPI